MPTSSRSPPTEKSPFVTRESSAFGTLTEVSGGMNKHEWPDDSGEDTLSPRKLHSFLHLKGGIGVQKQDAQFSPVST